ncbi:lantibiotic dehydratase [Jiangella endophytica]|uniref:lantibiotic dehydratase n=1 Tax=Jiangella endophytica TaxID=1623398 RepID=UPI000E3542F4|nr:lantibiotic dehydratase [Jiangella endophytica]
MTDLVDHAPAHAAPATGRAGWRFGDGFLLRVAGQPAAAVAELRTPAAAAWADRVLDLEAARDAAGEELRAVLEAAVAAAPDGAAHRIALINLRRDVFNARRPRPATLDRAAPGLTASGRETLQRWRDAVGAVAAELDRGAAVLADDLAAARGRARRLLADDDLRSAVLLQSEVLERTMDRYLDPARKLDKTARQIERTLLELLYRAALKTSPFSTLTAVGLGRFDGADPLPEPSSLSQLPSARLNVAVLSRLAAVILAVPELRDGVRVTLAPGASLDGDSVRYVRRRTATSADPDAVVAIDNVHEDLFLLPSGPALARVAELTRDQRLVLRELVDALAQGHDVAGRAEADQLAGHLLRLGFLLAPELQVDLRAADPAAVFTAALAGHAHPVLGAVAAELAAAGELVGRYPATPARERARVLAGVRGHVRAAFDVVGAPESLVPRTLVYEDTTVGSDGLAAARSAWDDGFRPDLAALADVLPAFDLNLSRRLTATGFFRARYGAGGRCDDVVRFCHEFQRDFFGPYLQRSMRRRSFDDDNALVRQENWFKLADLEALDDARAAASAHLREVMAASSAETEELRLGPDFADAVRRHLPDAARLRQPWSFFLQLAAGAGEEPGRLVLNQAYAGMTLMFSRFAHSLDAGGADATGLIRRTLRSYAAGDAVLAELRGGYETTNLNVHPVVTDYEIVCPGDASTRPPSEQIRLEELSLVHDEATDRVRLVSARLGREVVPVYLGFLMPMALPEVQQVLLCFSPSGMAQIDLWAGTGDPVPETGITCYPRLVLGDLVLQRRMWKLDVAAFPVRDPAHTDAEHLLRVRRWRREHGLPRRLFAQTDAAGVRSAVDTETGSGDDGGGGRKAGRKPLPVDFDSWLSLQLLDQLAQGASARIVLTEALPGTDELWLADPDGRRYVSEFLVELYDQPERYDEGSTRVR